MRIKRFEARDCKTAMALVKKELGEDAVILANKTLDKGTVNQRYEVLAAMDYDVENITLPWNKGNKSASESKYAFKAYSNPAGEDTAKTEIKPTIYGHDSFQRKQSSISSSQDNIPLSTSDQINFESHDLRMRFASFLRKNGASPPASKTQAKTDQIASNTKRPKPEEIAQWKNQLIDKLQGCQPQIPLVGQPQILALVGPTGVGKTTTSAKIAAWYKLRKNCRVALLSMDCYRIGATDQLRTYARIMQIPCEVALRKSDLAKAINRHKDCDLIIIDTAGKSPYDIEHIHELANWFEDIGHVEPLLTLSATTKKEDLKQIISSYDSLGPTGIILTKLDETRAYATLCQQVAEADIPVSFMTTGQKVPEDFFVASKNFLQSFFRKGWATVEKAEEQEWKEKSA